MGTLAEAIVPSIRSTGPAARSRRGRAGVGLDDGPVLGHEAQDTGAQCGDGQAELQARAADQRRVDRAHPGAGAVAQGVGQRLEVQDGAAARAQLAAHPGQPEACTGDQPQDVALAAAPGPPRPAPLVGVRDRRPEGRPRRRPARRPGRGGRAAGCPR